MATQMRSRSDRSLFLILSLLVFLFLPCRLTAQIDRGEVTGTVKDPSGAVVSGTKIVLTNDATNVTATTQSTSTGTYVFNNLNPGTYTIQADSKGFGTYVVHGLYVHVQQVLTTDISLEPAGVKQSVDVTAAAPLLQAENGGLGQTVTTETVNDLPLATRDWGSLAQLSAGVSTAPAGQPTPDSGSTASAYFSVNGINVWQNDFRLDGINDNIEFYGGNYTGTNAAIVPPPDAIQEFKVQNGDFNAEFGHSTGGVVNAALKSGTNRFHGDLWEVSAQRCVQRQLLLQRRQTHSRVSPEPLRSNSRRAGRHPSCPQRKGQDVLLRRLSGRTFCSADTRRRTDGSHHGHVEQRLYQSPGQHYV